MLGGSVRRSFKFLLRPTSRQADALRAMLQDHCDLYNAGLEHRREAWRRKAAVRYAGQAEDLKHIRAEDPEGQGRWSCSSQQATLRRLDRAFVNFYRRVKAGKKPGYPRFRSPARFDSVEWPRDGDGCKWDDHRKGATGKLRLQGIGYVRVHQHRPIPHGSLIKTITVKREAKRWFVIVSCDNVPAKPLPPTDSEVGIDLGVVSFLTTSDGAQISNPRFGAALAPRLQELRRAWSRTSKGSRRHNELGRRIGVVLGKSRNQRRDHAHKTALWLVRYHDFIAHEDMPTERLSLRPRKRPDGNGGYLRNNAWVKRGLNKAIRDTGWTMFLSILTAKAESAGRTIIAVDYAYTSRTCPTCGHAARENRLTQADFACVACGYSGHADVIGAINVLRAGLVLREAAQAAEREAASAAESPTRQQLNAS